VNDEENSPPTSLPDPPPESPPHSWAPASKKADPWVVALVGAGVLLSGLAALAELGGRSAPELKKTLARVSSFPITLEEIREANLSLKVARYWEPMEDGSVKCGLCPFNCIIPEGARGVCRVRANIGGKLRALTYGRPLARSVDPIEKKPLFHVLPGARALSIATAGCNLGCVFCQNWEISQAYPEKSPSYDLPPERVVELAIEKNCETIAYTYTEPSVFFEYMLDTARLARKRGLKNLWITCGYINPEPLEELCSVLDAANVDLKGFDEGFYRKYCKATLPPVLATIETLKAEGVFVEVTNLVIPGANDDPETIRRMCEGIARRLGPETPLHFSRFHGDYLLRDRPATPPETLVLARSLARKAGLKHVYIGNIRLEDGETTFCPSCGEPIIIRQGYWVRAVLMEDGKCRHCGAPVAGVWK